MTKQIPIPQIGIFGCGLNGCQKENVIKLLHESL